MDTPQSRSKVEAKTHPQPLSRGQTPSPSLEDRPPARIRPTPSPSREGLGVGLIRAGVGLIPLQGGARGGSYLNSADKSRDSVVWKKANSRSTMRSTPPLTLDSTFKAITGSCSDKRNKNQPDSLADEQEIRSPS